MAVEDASTKLVVDTSVAAKWYLTGELEEEAQEILDAGQRGEVLLLAPESVEPELWNVLWQRHRRGELSPEEVRGHWSKFREVPVFLTDVRQLMPPAVEVALRSGCIVYDALFVALADAEDAVVVTADEQLLRPLERTPLLRSGVARNYEVAEGCDRCRRGDVGLGLQGSRVRPKGGEGRGIKEMMPECG